MEFKCVSVLLVVSVLIGGTSLAEPVLWDVADGGNGHFYEAVAVPGGISWSNAKLAATAAGGYLATIISQAENDFVFGLIDEGIYWNNGNVGPWLGGFQPVGSVEPDGGWQWVTGEPFDYTNWDDNQPNDAASLSDCLHFGFGGGRVSTWDDMPDNWQDKGCYAYIIEYEALKSEPVEWTVVEGGNGHVYQAVAVPSGITWLEANRAAYQAGGYLG